ncbi:MAG: molybdopterin-dependent oxidoreductase, partial [Chloroflexia bacterium]
MQRPTLAELTSIRSCSFFRCSSSVESASAAGRAPVLTLLAVNVLALVGYGWLRHARRRQGAWLAGLVAATFGLGTLCTLWLIGYGTSSVGQTVGAATVAVSALVVCAAWALGLLLARRTAPYTSRATAPTGRRRFLVGGGVWAVLLAASIGGSGWALLQRISITSLRLDSRRTPAITPIPEFYLVSKNVLDPVVNAEEWRLTVEGAVERPMTFTLDELRALPATEQFATMECISNPVGGRLISTTLWRGVRLSEVLDRAGVRADVQDVVTVCADGYTESLELERATAPDVLLVYEMGGEPLTSKHGAPLRLQVPGRYGLKSSKWVERIRPTSENFLGYWQQESNWTDIGEVHTECRIDNLPGGRVRLGDATITGVAYTGLRGVSKVEVSTDGG